MLNFTPDSRELIITNNYSSNTGHIVNMNTGQRTASFRIADIGGETDYLQFSDSGRYFLTTDNGRVRVWDRSVQNIFSVGSGDTRYARSFYADFNGDETKIYMGAIEGDRVYIWDFIRNQRIDYIEPNPDKTIDMPPYRVVTSPDGNSLLTYNAHVLRIWNTDTLSLELDLGGYGSIQQAAFSPDGLYLAILRDGVLEIYYRGDQQIFYVDHSIEVHSNASWSPIEREFKDFTMVLAPPGCFMMGTEGGPRLESPVHDVCIDKAFCIDKFEINQGLFDLLNCRAERNSVHTDVQFPVDSITWFEARAFCEMRGMRLPTEAEWEYAARGPDSLKYPWGNEWIPDNSVWNHSIDEGPSNVGSLPQGISWVGAFHMAGNSAEWTNSLYSPYPYDAQDGRKSYEAESSSWIPASEGVLRTSSWYSSSPFAVQPSSRLGLSPESSVAHAGFRCAVDDGLDPDYQPYPSLPQIEVEEPREPINYVDEAGGVYYPLFFRQVGYMTRVQIAFQIAK